MAIIHDGGIDREMTAEEIAIAEATKLSALQAEQSEAEAQAAKQAAREALLTKLGITADEAQLLLGA